MSGGPDRNLLYLCQVVSQHTGSGNSLKGLMRWYIVSANVENEGKDYRGCESVSTMVHMWYVNPMDQEVCV